MDHSCITGEATSTHGPPNTAVRELPLLGSHGELRGWDPMAEPLENKERRYGPQGHEGKKQEEKRKSFLIVKEYTVKIV
ncbi:unnamed protein product [Gadus morhua 'NCC']